MYRLRFLFLAILSALVVILPVSAADRIYFNYGPLGFSLSVDSLANFAQEGKIDRQLAFFLNRLNPEQQDGVRNFQYQNAIALAFFKLYVDGDEEYRSYLQASYAKALSKEPYRLSLVQSVPFLTSEEN